MFALVCYRCERCGINTAEKAQYIREMRTNSTPMPYYDDDGSVAYYREIPCKCGGIARVFNVIMGGQV